MSRVVNEKQLLDEEDVHRFFSQVLSVFILPEIRRRQESGELEKPLNLRRAQVLFYPDGRRVVVRINEEVKALVRVKIKPEVSKDMGDWVHEHEIEHIEEVILSEDDDPDSAHITFLRFGNDWTLAFDARYNKALSKRHIETAEQFFKCAEFSLRERLWSSFLDNLFSAAELAAKSILLSISVPNLRDSATHTFIRSRLNLFHKQGNIGSSYKEAYNRLYALRNPARYLEGHISIPEDEAKSLSDIVQDMIAAAERLVSFERPTFCQ